MVLESTTYARVAKGFMDTHLIFLAVAGVSLLLAFHLTD